MNAPVSDRINMQNTDTTDTTRTQDGHNIDTIRDTTRTQHGHNIDTIRTQDELNTDTTRTQDGHNTDSTRTQHGHKTDTTWTLQGHNKIKDFFWYVFYNRLTPKTWQFNTKSIAIYGLAADISVYGIYIVATAGSAAILFN